MVRQRFLPQQKTRVGVNQPGLREPDMAKAKFSCALNNRLMTARRASCHPIPSSLTGGGHQSAPASWPTAISLIADPVYVPDSSMIGGFLPPFIPDRADPLAPWCPYHLSPDGSIFRHLCDVNSQTMPKFGVSIFLIPSIDGMKGWFCCRGRP